MGKRQTGRLFSHDGKSFRKCKDELDSETDHQKTHSIQFKGDLFSESGESDQEMPVMILGNEKRVSLDKSSWLSGSRMLTGHPGASDYSREGDESVPHGEVGQTRNKYVSDSSPQGRKPLSLEVPPRQLSPEIVIVDPAANQPKELKKKLTTNDLLTGKIRWQDPTCLCIFDHYDQPTIVWKQAIVFLKPKA